VYDQQLDLEYYHTRIMNVQREPLTLLISWFPGSGPVEASLQIKPLLKTFKPRFAAMTGICAGDKRKVKLGDLIVADRAYFYDHGKFILNQKGDLEQQHNADVYRASAKVRSFIRMFDPWKSLPVSSRAACHISALASGSAVRGDNPFEVMLFPVRDTLGIDMEGAAFYRSVEDFPGMEALLVKGVSDYADGQKDDSYHQRASAVSALYMLAFIQEFVTTERLPVNPHPI
jgi:nucleoside phosphorylase